MRIAFVGKGGSGKTTLSALFSRYLSVQPASVLAIDADINQHLGTTLGLTEEEAGCVPALGLEVERLQTYVRGSNPRIASNAVMLKTTPPGPGSRLLKLDEPNPVFTYFERQVGGVRLLVTGPFRQEDLGLKCYHAKVGAIEILLNHLLDGPGEYVVVDMTAGADAFASGMFTKFDLTLLVAEPTRKGVSVYQQYQDYAREYGVEIRVIGNKIETDDDVAFLREHVGDALLTWVGHSAFVRAMEKGRHLPFEQLEEANVQALATMKEVLDRRPKDWVKFYRQTVEFHRKNALAWANAQVGEDVTRQIDPAYTLPIQDSRQFSHVS